MSTNKIYLTIRGPSGTVMEKECNTLKLYTNKYSKRPRFNPYIAFSFFMSLSLSLNDSEITSKQQAFSLSFPQCQAMMHRPRQKQFHYKFLIISMKLNISQFPMAYIYWGSFLKAFKKIKEPIQYWISVQNYG